MNGRQRFFYNLLRPPVSLFLKLRFGYTYEVPKELPENYMVLSNHVTDYDPLFVGCSFKKPMAYVGSEHIARWKTAYPFINFAFDLILRSKGMSASSAIMTILRRLRGGTPVCMFAEGARTWDGVTLPISPTTGQMVKSARCALVTYRITGGYFVSPRWAKKLRRGYVHGAPVGIYTKEELAKMSAEEINALLYRDLHEDAYARQLADKKRYRGRNLAVGMEKLLHICPECGARDRIMTEKNTVHCLACSHRFELDGYGMLKGGRFATVCELAEWQRGVMEHDAAERTVYYDENAKLWNVADHDTKLVCEGRASLSDESLTCGDVTVPLDDIVSMAMRGRHALVFSTASDYYELIPSGSAYKFLMLFKEYTKTRANDLGGY